MKLSDIRQCLASRNIRLTKSLGQNFLHDANQLRRIVERAAVSKTDKVLEVGPGLGVLTELLLERAGEVFTIEIDSRLVEVMRERFGGEQRLTLVEGDALAYLRSEGRSWSDWKLVANLPYSIASPVMVELASARPGPRSLTATLQLEVARRLFASAGASDYGILTLLVQLTYEPVDLFPIPPTCFFPEPEVESACVHLVRRAEPLLPGSLHPSFRRIVKRAFSQRRKMMLKLVRADWEEAILHRAFESLGLDPRIRAEKLSLRDFVELTRLVAGSPP